MQLRHSQIPFFVCLVLPKKNDSNFNICEHYLFRRLFPILGELDSLTLAAPLPSISTLSSPMASSFGVSSEASSGVDSLGRNTADSADFGSSDLRATPLDPDVKATGANAVEPFSWEAIANDAMAIAVVVFVDMIFR